MRKIYVFILLLLCIAVSCEPEPQTSDLQNGIVNGIVIDKTTNAGIPNAVVYLLGNEGGGTWGGGGTPSFQIDQTVSDANGHFTFHFDYNATLGYYCSAVVDKYFNYYDEVSVDLNIIGKNNVEVRLQPIGYLQLHVKSINDYEATDHIDIQAGNITPLFGGDIDTTFLLSIPGNGYYHLVWFLYVDGVNEGSESVDIYCPAFDTTEYVLFY